jgi:hypothetical protein
MACHFRIAPLAEGPRSPGHYAVGEGPAIRLVAAAESGIQTLVVEVTSLARAQQLLAAHDLQSSTAADQLTLTPAALQGLHMRLVE